MGRLRSLRSKVFSPNSQVFGIYSEINIPALGHNGHLEGLDYHLVVKMSTTSRVHSTARGTEVPKPKPKHV